MIHIDESARAAIAYRSCHPPEEVSAFIGSAAYSGRQDRLALTVSLQALPAIESAAEVMLDRRNVDDSAGE